MKKLKYAKHLLKAEVYSADITDKIKEVAEKVGIILPSTHTAIFRTVYAQIEVPNGNGVRLAKEAVEKSLPGLIGSQVNIGHQGHGFIVGIILDAFLNENDEIETIFTFAKNIYDVEYEDALEKMREGALSVSFELFTTIEGQEFLADGTVRLHDIDFQGQGFLIDEAPACNKAIVFEMAKRYKSRAINAQEKGDLKEKELVFASKIIKTCDKVLAEEHSLVVPDDFEELLWTTITTRVDQHIHVIKIDMEGDGESKGTFGDNEKEHTHKIVNYQVQEKGGHAHRLLEELMAKRKEFINKQSKNVSKNKQNINEDVTQTGGNKQMTEEQKKLIAKLREEFGDHAKDISDEQLLDEAKVEEIRKAKTEAENKEKEATDLEKAEAKVVELEAENAELKATIEAKDSEIDSVRENAEKIGKLKVELKDNSYVAEFSDEDYLDEGKIETAKIKKENDDLKSKNKTLTTENAETKTKLKASKDNVEDLETGHKDDETVEDVHSVLQEHYATKEDK